MNRILDACQQNLAHGLRLMRKNPGFTVTVVLFLGLGIGINTAVFSLANALFLRPLIPASEGTLVRAYTSYEDGLRWGTLSYPDYRDLADRTNAFRDLAAERVVAVNLGGGDYNERVYGSMVSPNYFRTLGLKTWRGRTFGEGEGVSAADSAVVVLSHSLWRRRFDSTRQAVGESLQINGRAFTIIGIAPEDFRGTNIGFNPGFWLPLQAERLLTPSSNFLESRESRSLFVLGVLADGVGVEQATTQLNQVAADLAVNFPESNRGTSITVIPAEEGSLYPAYRGTLKGILALLLGVVGIVLLVACANVAALFLARARGRQREISVRLALGAGRGRLIGQLLSESVLLALAAAGFGIFLAVIITRFLETFSPLGDLPLHFDFSLDLRVLLFALLVAVGTGVLFGLAPALQLTRKDLVTGLKDDGSSSGFRRSRLRAAFVVGQVTLSLILVIVAGLFIRGLQQARQVDVGFDTTPIIAGSVDLDLVGYDETVGRRFLHELHRRLEAVPAIERASLAAALPLELFGHQRKVAPVEGAASNDEKLVDYTVVSPRYFETLGIAIEEGRSFTAQDDPEAPRVAIINRIMAQRLWPDQPVLGKHLRSGDITYSVVGIAKDSKYTSLAESPKPFLYLPLEQSYHGAVTILARVVGNPEGMLSTLRQEVQALDPALAVYNAQTLDQHLAVALLPARSGAYLLSAMGLFAVGLAALGLYSTLAYSVSQRTREFGIRLCLGAQNGDVLGQILREGMRLAAVGLILGLLIAALVTHLLASLLYGISPFDLVAFVGGSVLLTLIALLACLLPARRAVGIHPFEALRIS